MHAPVARTGPAVDATPVRILLVDDEPPERAAVLEALARGGVAVDVAEAHDLASAAAALATGRYDCVLVDASLPDGAVEEVIAHAARSGSTPSIALFDADGDREHASTRGAADRLPRARLSSEWLVNSILHVLRAQALERKEAEARGALARHTSRLQALVDASARIHAAGSVDEVAAAAAEEARALFDARAARVEVGARGGVAAALRDAPDNVTLDTVGAVRVELRDAAGAAVGAMTLAGSTLSESDAPLLAQLARTAASALENAWLLRRSTDASLARDLVLASVSHDLRSPLATVTLGAHLLRASLEARGREAEADALTVRRIARACERMARLVDNLLDAAQLAEGPLRIVPRACDAAELVREAADAAALAADAARVTIRAAPTASLRVLADRERVLQVFSNLVTNALKVTPSGGEVALSVAPDGADARFSVEDTGPGVPAAQRATLFERYARGSGGHGLGLYIARHIVEALRGRIDAHEGAGGGAIFSFTLPLA